MWVLLNPDPLFPKGMIVAAYLVLSRNSDSLLVKFDDEQMEVFAQNKKQVDRWVWKSPGTYKVLEIEDYERKFSRECKHLIGGGEFDG